MDFIFRGDQGVAINPDYLFIRSVREDDKDYYNIRACYNDGDHWVRITKSFESYEEVVEAYKAIYKEAIETALNLKI